MSSITKHERATYWRSVEQLASSDAFARRVAEEFPSVALAELTATNRRQFLRMMASTFALAGAFTAGCRRWPESEIRPHAMRPEGFQPGMPVFYATQFVRHGVSTGLIVKCVDGRPIKVEGNTLHPGSLGATDAIAQSMVLDLYDPDRSQRVTERVTNDGGETVAKARTWEDFEAFWLRQKTQHVQNRGRGLAVLSQSIGSPTLARLRAQFEIDYPNGAWYCYEPLARDHERRGAEIAFGQSLRPRYSIQRAKVMACFECDLLGEHPNRVRWSRDWAERRQPLADEMSRMYCVESGYSLTGAAADLRLAVPPSRVKVLIAHLASLFGLVESPDSELDTSELQFVEQLFKELHDRRGESLIAVGPAVESTTHALAFALNQHLGNFGETISFVRLPDSGLLAAHDAARHLSRSLDANEIDTLVVMDGNPAFDGPAELVDSLAAVERGNPTIVHLSYYANETSHLSDWQLPMAHDFECWGDGWSWDGAFGVQQPMIEPMFDGKSSIELAAMLLGDETPNAHELVRRTMQDSFAHDGLDFENQWRQVLHDGVSMERPFPEVIPTEVAIPEINSFESTSEFELRFVRDHGLDDGRHAGNAWLQELPDPLTKLTWGNAAQLSPHDAKALQASTGDIVRITVASKGGESNGSRPRSVEIPVYVLPGHAVGCVTLPIGYGRTEAGNVGSNVGVNVYPLQHGDNPYVVSGATIEKTGDRTTLASTQEHHLIDSVGRQGVASRVGDPGKSGSLLHESTLDGFLHNPTQLHPPSHAPAAPLFDPPDQFQSPHAWGMSIDLNLCIGCNSCTVACQAENNIPVVGKDNVIANREMHWLRVDRYFKGNVDDPDVVHVPMACNHCETAPCEQVCPVAATVHDSEGLNAMVYNRCVGTRYCANNCPYKVRRFNYFDYHASNPRRPATPWVDIPDRQPQQISPLTQLGFNPEVTVRMRGVMEKCTYCVQRISAARHEARLEHAKGNRDEILIEDGEVITACQASCPTQAIRFGDLNDEASGVSKSHHDPRSYSMLDELNLRPRTKHMARIRNRPGTGTSDQT